MKIRGNSYIFITALLLMSVRIATAEIEEIIVTAEFREESVQDTPLAITVVDSAMMEARNQTNIFEIGGQAPNVTLSPSNVEGGPAMLAFIRGVGQTDFNYALEPGVGFYVDEVYFPTLTGTMVELLDLERVEILRGPQGTLSGRNSIGGSIKLFSQLPGKGKNMLEATKGSYGRLDFGGATNITVLEDKLYARLTGVSRSRDGHVTRRDYGCSNPDSGVPSFSIGDLSDCKLGAEGGIGSFATRLSLLWDLTDDVAINISYDHSKEDSEPAAGTLLHVNENLNTMNGYGEGTFIVDENGNRIHYDERFIPGDPYVNYATYLDPNAATPTRPYSPVSVPAVNKLDQEGIATTVNWQINDSLSAKLISAYREYEADWSYDGDLSPVNGELLFQRLEHNQRSHELRLSGLLFDGLLDYTLGAFYFDQDGTLEARVNLFYAQLNFIHGPDPTPSESRALFANGTWHILEDLNLSMGARYSEDEKDYVYYRRNPDGTAPVMCTQPAPPFNINNPANCALFGFSGQTAHFEDERVDWRIALDYSITDDFMMYGQVATGYKAGGINPRPFFTEQIDSVDPEELTSYELGFKSYLFSRRVLFNGAFFFNDYTDIQLQQDKCEVPFSAEPQPPCLKPENAGDADVRGIELEGLVDLDNGLMLDASFSYLDFEYTRVAANVAVTKDMTAPYTPKIQFSAGIQYTLNLDFGTLVPRLNLTYQDEIYAHPVNASRNRIDSYALLNTRITWTSPDKKWEVSAIMNNITDKLYYHSIFDQYGNTGSVIGRPGLPRTVGITLKRYFGDL